jgi:truncated hemoglobin YjbI
MGFNRDERKNTALTREQQKNRPIQEKESRRWLERMENAERSRDVASSKRQNPFSISNNPIITPPK